MFRISPALGVQKHILYPFQKIFEQLQFRTIQPYADGTFRLRYSAAGFVEHFELRCEVKVVVVIIASRKHQNLL